ncbi:hypothetical protein CCH79_00019009 [Gambusia affinis]|uniref:BPTI/Kunitz inhibitor domain-containing protein n=1 Tax=Gambusia affinis TaxID=33528 RepID=A0A315VXI1_GAMAF|nr:hypothetical protein CCH79_00019009 [Gambusia affinis]
MFRFCTSSLLLLVLLRGAQRGAAEQCGGDAFVSGSENFVLDAKDAVEDGAALLDTQTVFVDEDCEALCCQDPRCNLALLEPRDGEERTCVLFNCVHKNRFVCQFVNQAGYESYIRRSMYRRYLEAPDSAAVGLESAEWNCPFNREKNIHLKRSDMKMSHSELALPIANAGPDIVLQPGENVTLNGSESMPLHHAKISDYKWTQQSGDQNLKLEKTKYDDQVRLSNLQPGSYVLKLTVTDSRGKSGHDTVTIKVLTPELSSCECSWEIAALLQHALLWVSLYAKLLSSLLCKLGHVGSHSQEVMSCSPSVYCLAPPKTGPCRAAFPRWYYNTTTGSCEKFTYGGCLPNKNNFLFNQECMSACRGVTVSSERSITINSNNVLKPAILSFVTVTGRATRRWQHHAEGLLLCSSDRICDGFHDNGRDRDLLLVGVRPRIRRLSVRAYLQRRRQNQNQNQNRSDPTLLGSDQTRRGLWSYMTEQRLLSGALPVAFTPRFTPQPNLRLSRSDGKNPVKPPADRTCSPSALKHQIWFRVRTVEQPGAHEHFQTVGDEADDDEEERLTFTHGDERRGAVGSFRHHLSSINGPADGKTDDLERTEPQGESTCSR